MTDARVEPPPTGTEGEAVRGCARSRDVLAGLAVVEAEGDLRGVPDGSTGG